MRNDSGMGMLILLRHGQAALGEASYDALSELGRHQARLAGARLARGLPIERIHSGNLVRQRDTAAATLDALGWPRARLTVDARWDEYDHISVLAGHTSSVRFETARTAEDRRALQNALDEAIARWMSTGEHADVESHDAFTGRVLAAAAELAARPGVSVAVTSGGVIAVIAAHRLGLPLSDWPRLAALTINTGITRLITGSTGTRLLTFNDHAHLEADRTLMTYR